MPDVNWHQFLRGDGVDDVTLLSQAIRNRVTDEVSAHYARKYNGAWDALGHIWNRRVQPDGETLGELISRTHTEFIQGRVEECLPDAMKSVVSKVTLALLTEDHNGKAEKEPA